MTETLLINILTYSGIIFVYVTFIFGIALVRRDNSVMDIAYGPAFAIGAWGFIGLHGTTTPLGYLLTVLISLWATRLAIRIYRKNHGKPEDARYAAWRQTWKTRGRLYFTIRSYVQINLLQGLIISIVALPFIVAASAPVANLGIITYIGIAVFWFGFMYESLADWQLDQFLNRKRNGTETAVLMTSGLFRYSRRPNYFGESLIWWGLALMVVTLPFGLVALLSPLLITYIVTRVTGPMLEQLFLEKYPTAYRAYMRTTNYFVPWLPKT